MVSTWNSQPILGHVLEILHTVQWSRRSYRMYCSLWFSPHTGEPVIPLGMYGCPAVEAFTPLRILGVRARCWVSLPPKVARTACRSNEERALGRQACSLRNRMWQTEQGISHRSRHMINAEHVHIAVRPQTMGEEFLFTQLSATNRCR
jgi:hypothetical protein